VLRRYVRGRRWLSFALLGFAGVVLAGCGWGWAVWHALVVTRHDAELLFPGAEVLAPLPYVLMLLGCWAAYHRAELALHRTAPPEVAARAFWTRPGYVLFHARQLALLVLFPVALFAAQQGLTRAFPDTVRSAGYQVVAVAGGVLLFVFMPRLVKPLLGLKRLPAGPARDHLEATARRLDCRLTDLLVWPTRGAVANALVIGVTPWARYVIVTDRLLENLPPDELAAVFGHEAGHVNRGHIPYYAGFFALSSAVAAALMVGAEQLVERWGWMSTGRGPGWLAVPPVLLLCGYVFAVFGLVSRRCERQADVYGARAGSCDDPGCTGHLTGVPLPAGDRHLCRAGAVALVNALNHVAALNGWDSPTVPAGFWPRAWARVRAWQHGPVGERVEFLLRLAEDPALGDRTDRAVNRFRWAVLGLLAAALGGLGTAVGWGELWARL
jgi:Zn-dependent protease with chaperone function